jgi:hypothetical protein
VPSVAHPSERIATHARHEPPSTPHAIGDCGRHVGPEQHPLGQLAIVQPLHAPAAQVSPSGHAAHAWPAPPQAVASLPERQTLPSQQPAHDAESQTHVPSSQA